ncbi:MULTISPECIES: EpsG family protein [Bacteroidales]|uniref:EpsG-like putative glucosyltransferase n=1 Tax=Porphyromonas loveana TaxID=1884669 RepID=A0A2U1FKS6_9PORP|nr:EpsG family protein [Porphyromonas loveana]PVZ12781.1 EpsG-like putative glucosyltransferase [Porphyromonas loveana]
MLPYFVLFLLLAVLFIADYYDKRFRPFVLSVAAIALIVFSGSRIGMGRDYALYEEAFQYPEGRTALFFELTWQWINKGFHLLNLDFHFWLLFTAAITILLMFYGMKKMSHNIIVSIIAFVLIYRGYFETMNLIRQYVAMSIIFASFPLFLSQKHIYFFSLIGIAALFHTSALYMLVLVPLTAKKLNTSTMVGLLIATLIFGALILNSITEYAVSALPERYGFYIEEQFTAAGSSSGIYQLFLNITAIFFAIIQPTVEKKDKKIAQFILLYVASICIYNMTICFEVGMRLMFYPFIFIFILIPNIYTLSDKKWQKVAISAILIMFSLFMFKDLSNPMEPYITYKSILF